MAKGLFESPKKALLFVGMTMFSVAMLVGTEDEEGALIKAASAIDPGGQAPDARYMGNTPSQDRADPYRDDAPPTVFASDEELIDSAEGFDPTPEGVEPYEPETDLGASETQVVRSGAEAAEF